jgi:glucose 1-dehydrogenase
MADQSYAPPNEMPRRPMGRVVEGQKALVTGASKGVGAGIAVALAQAGADVLVNYHSDREGAEQVAAEIRKVGRTAILFKADVGKEDEVAAMFRAMTE